MPFVFNNLEIDGLLVIKPHIYSDERGQYLKIYEKDIFSYYGIDKSFNETSIIVSKKGVIRGLHYQSNNSQAKLIFVLRGEIYDVILDLRPYSASFGKHIEIKMTDKDDFLLYIPEGCAHGFQSLTHNSIFVYQSCGKYIESESNGINCLDKSININWPIKDKMIISKKDKSLQSFDNYKRSIDIL